MDVSRPIEALIPGAQGQLLGALVGAGRELNTKTVSEIAGVSAPHASRVLAHLVALGLVERRDVPPVALYSIAAGSILSGLLDQLSNLRSAVFDEMARAAADMIPRPVRVVVFGSVARGESNETSDIDVLVIVPSAVVDTDEWTAAVIGWRERVSRFAASTVEVLEVGEDDWHNRSFDNELWRAIERDGIVVFDQVNAL